jgi:hypothetical protein
MAATAGSAMTRLYGRRRRLSEAEIAANEAERLQRERDAMTCQICNRKILANTGIVAHHGYQRPDLGSGWQTQSCFGARELPFEVSRDKLGEWIRMLHDRREREHKHLAELFCETVPCGHSYGKYVTGVRKPQTVHLTITRDTFAAIVKEHDLNRHGYLPSFDELKARCMAAVESTIRNLDSDNRSCQARYDQWKQSHVWHGEWKCIS